MYCINYYLQFAPRDYRCWMLCLLLDIDEQYGLFGLHHQLIRNHPSLVLSFGLNSITGCLSCIVQSASLPTAINFSLSGLSLKRVPDDAVRDGLTLQSKPNLNKWTSTAKIQMKKGIANTERKVGSLCNMLPVHYKERPISLIVLVPKELHYFSSTCGQQELVTCEGGWPSARGARV